MKYTKWLAITILLITSSAFAMTIKEEPVKAPETNMKKEDYLKELPGDRVLGNKDAKITVVEYSSLSCPHCAMFYNDIFPGLKKDYVDTGKVKFIMRDFPLNLQAVKATMMIECAPKERYMNFVNILFKDQDSWAFTEKYLEKLESIAKLGGMSGEDFQKCVTNKAAENKILENVKFAVEKLGINATPIFYINGKEYHFNEFRSYKRLFDKMLKS